MEYLGGVWRDREVTLGQPLLVGRLENRRDKQTNGIRVSPGRIRCRTQHGGKPFKTFPSLSALPGENIFSLSDKTGPLIFWCGTTSTAVCLVELVENWATTLSTETLEQEKITFNERSDLDFFFLSPFHRWFEHSIKRWEGQVSGALVSELSSSDSVHQGPPTRTHQLFCLGQLPLTSACRQEQPGPPNLFYVCPTHSDASLRSHTDTRTKCSASLTTVLCLITILQLPRESWENNIKGSDYKLVCRGDSKWRGS